MNLGRMFAVVVLAFQSTSSTEPGFTPIAPGKDPGGAFDRVEIVAEGVEFLGREIRLAGSSRGYLATKASYTDFTLRLAWRFEVPAGTDLEAFEGNSGVLLRIAGPAKVWPDCLEVQISPEDPGALFAIGGGFAGKVDLDARQRAAKPVGEWNEIEIEAVGDKVVSRLNGLTVASGTYPRRAGPIGFQSQVGAVRFRDLRIKAGVD